MRPIAELVDPHSMSPADRDELWGFFSPMVNRPREQFERGLGSFPEVRIWRHPDTRALLGFSACRWLVLDVEGTPVDMLFFGWAALAPALRGSGLPFRDGFLRFVGRALTRVGRPRYLIFAASTTKSYKALVRYGTRCWPQPGRPMPEEAAKAVAALMAAQGEQHYDPATGVLRRFGAQRYHEGLYTEAPDDPLVAYYAERNPGQHEGDTLLVAYPIHLASIVSFGWRVLVAAVRRGARS